MQFSEKLVKEQASVRTDLDLAVLSSFHDQFVFKSVTAVLAMLKHFLQLDFSISFVEFEIEKISGAYSCSRREITSSLQ